MHNIKSQNCYIPTVCFFYGMHSRTIPIVLATVVYVIVYYSSLFQYFFYQSTMVPTLVEDS